MRILFTVTLTLVLFYLTTAVIYGNGGPGEMFVVKPFHGLVPFYGGGEENSWKNAHPDEPLPWWHYPNKNYFKVFSTSSETTIPLWILIYTLGYYFSILLVLISASALLFKSLRSKAEQGAAANP
jgi:hypothetical protein